MQGRVAHDNETTPRASTVHPHIHRPFTIALSLDGGNLNDRGNSMIGSEIESFVAPWLAACLIAVYLAPALIAFNRKVPNRVSVAVINVFLGWTFVGWVVALAMAVRSVPTKEAVTEAPPGGGA